MKKLAPYQIFFPLGVFNAFLAIGVWFVQELGWFQTPAMLIHAKLIAGGFLWCFIVGFLMTAIPKMTATASANKLEYFLSLLFMFLLMIFSWSLDARPFYLTHMMLVVFVLGFGLRRLLQSNKAFPVFFSHIGLGMLLALVGSVFYFQGQSFMGIHLFHVGAVLLLVLGIGTRFFSFLSGLPSIFENTEAQTARVLFHSCGLLMAFLLYCAGRGFTWAYLGLTLVSLVYLFAVWKVQRKSERASALKYGVRIVALMIPLSFFLSWLKPAMYVTWLHLLFIGCFALITFAVATRVVLAHGSYSTDLEMKSKTLWWVVGLLVLGVLSRVGYGFTLDPWFRKFWLHLAATFWVFAVGAWCYSYLKKIFVPGQLSKPSC